MSFSVIRSIAYSSLATTQVQMSVASSNIANADTEGYTRKTAAQASVSAGSIGGGVTIASIGSSVDRYLLKDLVQATTALGAATVTDSFYTKLQSLLGSTSSDGTGTSIANSLADLESALSSLAGTPESETLKAQAVSALDTLATQLRETSAGLQELRADADASIETSVGAVNDALDTIASLNKQIATAAARGDSTADLEDQRNTALQTVAGQMDVSYYVTSDNQMRLYTGSGTALVDGSAHKLSYDSAAFVTAGTVFGAITVEGKDITSEIGSGTIGGLIAMRDAELPAAQSALDELAANLADALNGVHNGGTSTPAPATVTGTKAVAAGDAFSASGTTRFAVVDSAGALVSYQDLDLSAYATVGELADAIDAIDGLAASIDANGKLVITAEDGTKGVAIADIGAAVGSEGEGFSAYFGLNDLVTGTSAATFSVRSDILSAAGLLATSELSTASSPATGASAVSSGANVVAQRLGEALTGSTDFAAAGHLSAAKTTFADYAARIVADIATSAASASTALSTKEAVKQSLSDTLASQTGVNLDEETARLSELEQQYSTAAQILSVLNAMFEALLAAAQSA